MSDLAPTAPLSRSDIAAIGLKQLQKELVLSQIDAVTRAPVNEIATGRRTDMVCQNPVTLVYVLEKNPYVFTAHIFCTTTDATSLTQTLTNSGYHQSDKPNIYHPDDSAKVIHLKRPFADDPKKQKCISVYNQFLPNSTGWDKSAFELPAAVIFNPAVKITNTELRIQIHSDPKDKLILRHWKNPQSLFGEMTFNAPRQPKTT